MFNVFKSTCLIFKTWNPCPYLLFFYYLVTFIYGNKGHMRTWSKQAYMPIKNNRDITFCKYRKFHRVGHEKILRNPLSSKKFPHRTRWSFVYIYFYFIHSKQLFWLESTKVQIQPKKWLQIRKVDSLS